MTIDARDLPAELDELFGHEAGEMGRLNAIHRHAARLAAWAEDAAGEIRRLRAEVAGLKARDGLAAEEGVTMEGWRPTGSRRDDGEASAEVGLLPDGVWAWAVECRVPSSDERRWEGLAGSEEEARRAAEASLARLGARDRAADEGGWPMSEADDYLVLVFEARERDAWQWAVLGGGEILASGREPGQEAARARAYEFRDARLAASTGSAEAPETTILDGGD